jgi:hypothetical protein
MGRSRSSNLSPTAGVVAGLFFPQREALGLEKRRLSPGVIGALVMLAGELRSFERAAVVYQRLCGGKVPAKTIQRLVAQIGPELVAERDADSGSCFEHRVESPPQTAVVQCAGETFQGADHDPRPGRRPGRSLSGLERDEVRRAVPDDAPPVRARPPATAPAGLPRSAESSRISRESNAPAGF